MIDFKNKFKNDIKSGYYDEAIDFYRNNVSSLWGKPEISFSKTSRLIGTVILSYSVPAHEYYVWGQGGPTKLITGAITCDYTSTYDANTFDVKTIRDPKCSIKTNPNGDGAYYSLVNYDITSKVKTDSYSQQWIIKFKPYISYIGGGVNGVTSTFKMDFIPCDNYIRGFMI